MPIVEATDIWQEFTALGEADRSAVLTLLEEGQRKMVLQVIRDPMQHASSGDAHSSWFRTLRDTGDIAGGAQATPAAREALAAACVHSTASTPIADPASQSLFQTLWATLTGRHAKWPL